MKMLRKFALGSVCTVGVLLSAGSFSAPAAAQDYWEYDRWEREWEHHFPTRGFKYEYEDDGQVEVEAEQYEWEPGEGYHEQEWYDPSDWFSTGRDIDYEYDDGYDYNYDYDYYTDDRYGDDVTFERWYWLR